MGFYEAFQAYQRRVLAEYQARQERMVVELRPVVEQARRDWLGRLVREYDPVAVNMAPNAVISQEGWMYGEVADIDERGRIKVLVSVGAGGQLAYRSGSLDDLGTRYRLVDVLPFESEPVVEENRS